MLVVNAWIIGGSWIDYVGSRQGVQTITREHLAWGRAQVEGLFAPYAAAAGRRAGRPGGRAGRRSLTL